MKKVIKRIILIIVIAFAALLTYGAYLDATGYDPDGEATSSPTPVVSSAAPAAPSDAAIA